MDEGGGGGDSPPARLKQIQFALNRKHAFFDVISSNNRPEESFVLSFLCRKTVPQHNF